ncbi:MAG: type I glyceraldehyde-3-phosphate dehydrogenase [Desulfobacterales bacterium]
MPKIAINGLGRIGRAVLKIVMDTPDLELAAVNDLISTENLAYLLKYDSVYGRYDQTVAARDGQLDIGRTTIPVFSEKDPARLPWEKLGIDGVFECTGVFRNKEGLQKHLEAGAGWVILSAPAKGVGVAMVVHGVNRSGGDSKMISCASCTTNCISPVVEVMERYFGIRKAVMTTVHAYTASQAIVDGPRNKWRRGRAAAVSFVPTSTGAARATTEILPDLKGRFDGIAVRGPVPVGSLADMVFVTKKSTTAEEVNRIFRDESQASRYEGILGVTEDPIVSADIIRDPRASIVDLTMTTVVDSDLVKVLSWYDNEWGYSSQMVREMLRLVG